MEFIDELHECRYNTLIKIDNTHIADVERRALLYILSSESFFHRIDELYHFDDRCIRLYKIYNNADGGEMLKASTNFSSSERMLITVAYNLFNGYTEEYMSPVYLFRYSDEIAFLVMNAIKIRFGLK